MSSKDLKNQTRLKRKKRIRKKISGTPERPRLSVFRSARHIYVQAVDDITGHTIAAASSLEKAARQYPDSPKDSETPENALSGKIATADAVGRLIARRIVEKGIKQVVFDRNGFLYHGRVRAVADGARKGGLEF